MTDPIPVRAYASTGVVSVQSYERLRAMTQPHGWLALLTDSGDGTFRAWLRGGPDESRPSRVFGRPAASPQEAVERLIAKVEPYAAGGVR